MHATGDYTIADLAELFTVCQADGVPDPKARSTDPADHSSFGTVSTRSERDYG